MKTQKAKKKYGVGKKVHNGVFYDAHNRFVSDFPFYKKWCRKAQGAVLELCCGTGRLTVPLAKSGIDITGLDIEPSMLSKAREKALQNKVRIPLIRSDMKKFSLKKKYKLIFIPFNSIQNTYDWHDIEKIFANVKMHLAKGGLFILDIFNPNLEMMVKKDSEPKAKYISVLPDGKKVVIKESREYDAEDQVNRVLWHYYINGKKDSIEKLDMRCFFPQEMDALLYYNGFRILHKFGDFDGEPFTSRSSKQIYVLKLAK